MAKPITYRGKLDAGFTYFSDFVILILLGKFLGGKNLGQWIYETVFRKKYTQPGKRYPVRDEDIILIRAFNGNLLPYVLQQLFFAMQPLRKLSRGITDTFSRYKSRDHIARDLLQIVRGLGNLLLVLMTVPIMLIVIPVLAVILTILFQFQAYDSKAERFTDALRWLIVFPLITSIPMLFNQLLTAMRGVLQIVTWPLALARFLFIRGPLTLWKGYQPVHQNAGINAIARIASSRLSLIPEWITTKPDEIKAELIEKLAEAFAKDGGIERLTPARVNDLLNSRYSIEPVPDIEAIYSSIEQKYQLRKGSLSLMLKDTTAYDATTADVSFVNKTTTQKALKAYYKAYLMDTIESVEFGTSSQHPLGSFYFSHGDTLGTIEDAQTPLNEELHRRCDKARANTQGSSPNSSAFLATEARLYSAVRAHRDSYASSSDKTFDQLETEYPNHFLTPSTTPTP